MNDDLITIDLLSGDYNFDGLLGQERPFHKLKKQTREEVEMSRMTYDGVLLQANLAFGEIREITEIASTLFTREGEETGKVAMNRARAAAKNLVTMKHARAIPNIKEMVKIVSTASEGTQLGALMNLTIRRAEQERAEDRRTNETANDGTEKVVLADLSGSIHSIM